MNRSVLGEVEWRVMERSGRELEEDRESELEKRWKKDVESEDGKAIRRDGISTEVWKYGGSGKRLVLGDLHERGRMDGRGNSAKYKKGKGRENRGVKSDADADGVQCMHV